MRAISIEKFRGLQQISTKRGTITALALDHRQNLRNANPAFVDDEELSRFKVDVTAGASGVAIGRAVWKEAVHLSGSERQVFLRTTATHRISRLTSLCHALARLYTDFYQAETSFDWYKEY